MTYNPFITATQSAVAELTSDRARQYYSIRAQADIQATVDAAITVGIGVYQFLNFAYTLGQMVAAELRAAVEDAQPGPLAIATLKAAVEEAVDIIEAEIIESRLVSQVAIAGYLPRVQAPVVIDKASKTRSVKRRSMTNKELLAECDRLGVIVNRKAKRAELLAALDGAKVGGLPAPTKVRGVSID